MAIKALYRDIPKVVRVQTGENVNVAISDEVHVVDYKGNRMDIDEESDDEFEELVAESTPAERNLDYLEEGAGVAYELDGLFCRGKITKCLGDGKFHVRFVNGKSYSFSKEKTKKARYVNSSMTIFHVPCPYLPSVFPWYLQGEL